MGSKFFEVGDIVKYGQVKARIETKSENGIHEITILAGPEKGMRVKAAFTVLKNY